MQFKWAGLSVCCGRGMRDYVWENAARKVEFWYFSEKLTLLASIEWKSLQDSKSISRACHCKLNAVR